MESLGQLSSVYVGIVWGMVLLFFLLWLYRAYRTVYEPRDRMKVWELGGGWYAKLLKGVFGVSMLMMAINTPFYFYIGVAFKPLIPAYLTHLVVFVILLLAVWEVVFSLTVSQSLLHKTSKMVGLTVIVLFLGPLSIYLGVNIPNMFQYPSSDECHEVGLPVKGKWLANHAGGSEVVNYHCAIPSQCYAMDIVKANDKGKFYKDDGQQLEDFYTMGEPVYAPVDGNVVQVVDTLSNKQITFTPYDTANPAGNHVVIQFQEDGYLFLAHLDTNSARVQVGDTVKRGDRVGSAGNTGNTSWPHLHMHIQDHPEINHPHAAAQPYRISQMKRKRWWSWSTVKDGYIIRNDYFHPLSGN